MRVLKRNPWLTGLGAVLAVLGLWCGSARAEINTDQNAAVLIFPKVIADGTRDTIIQITNTRPMAVQAHCEYLNGTGRCSGIVSGVLSRICVLDSDCPVGEACLDTPGVTCQAGDFDIGLTANQPTMWRVSTGRQLNVGQPTDPGRCNPPGDVCPGFDAGGQVPPPPGGTDGFQGELRCFEVDVSGNLIAQNALKGEAIIQTLADGQISEYNAIGARGITVVGDLLVNLDNDEYDACPSQSIMNHHADGADNLIAAGDPLVCPVLGSCPVESELTIVPCSIDYELLLADIPMAGVQFVVHNELEQRLSASVEFACWFNGRLSQIAPNFTVAALGTTLAKTRVRPVFGRCDGGDRDGLGCSANDQSQVGCPGGGVCEPGTGLLAVGESFYASDAGICVGGAAPPGALCSVSIDTCEVQFGIGSSCEPYVGTAAYNLHMEGSRGTCRITGAPCTTDGDCDGGDPDDLCATDVIRRITPP